MGKSKLDKKIAELKAAHKDSTPEELFKMLAQALLEGENFSTDNSKLKDDLVTANTSISTLNAEKSTLESEKATLQSKLDSANEQIKEQAEDIESLNAQLSEFESGKKKARKHPSVKLGGKDYLVTRGIQIGDTIYSAQQVADNKEVISGVKIGDYLLKKGSGILKAKA